MTVPSFRDPATTAESRVSPNKPIEAQKIKLSLQDAYSPKVWVTQTHFWPLDGADAFDRSYAVLREGIARLVVDFPILLSTIQRGPTDDHRDLEFDIAPNATVEFGRVDLRNIDGVDSYADLKARGFPMAGIRDFVSPVITSTPVYEGRPMFAAQLNRLDGGLAMTFGFNHLYTDASAITELERVWAAHTADACAGIELQTYRAPVDVAAIRHRLSSPVPGAAEFDEAHWARFPADKSQLYLPPAQVKSEAAMTMLEKTKQAHLEKAKGQGSHDVKWCMWYFSPESLVQLKVAAASADKTQWISTMDALIGLFWSRIAKAKQKSKEGHTSSQVCFPINIRPRLEPAVDSKYIGNLIDILVAQCPMAELESDEAGLAAGARSVRSGVAGWRQSTWESWLTAICALPRDDSICPNPILMLANQNLAFNDYSKSQSNTLDWGQGLGRIDRTRYLRPAASLAYCATGVVVHPRLADGGLEVATTCDEHIRSALEADPLFTRFARLTAEWA